MPELNTKAIVLRVFDFRETSQIAHLLTPDYGNITVIAKGVRQPRPNPHIPNPLELFTLLNVSLYYRSPTTMAILKEAIIDKTFLALRQDIKIIAVISLCGEIIDKSVEPEKGSPELFYLLEHLLTALNQKRVNAISIGAKYLLKLVAQLGYLPQLEQCLRCQKKQDLKFFSAEKATVVCSLCAKTLSGKDAGSPLRLIMIDAGELRAMRKILDSSLAEFHLLRLSRPQAKKIIDIVLALTRYHLFSAPLRSWRFFKQTAFPDLFPGETSDIV